MSLLKSQKRSEHASETSKWQHKMKSKLWYAASDARWTERPSPIFSTGPTGKIQEEKKK